MKRGEREAEEEKRGGRLSLAFSHLVALNASFQTRRQRRSPHPLPQAIMRNVVCTAPQGELTDDSYTRLGVSSAHWAGSGLNRVESPPSLASWFDSQNALLSKFKKELRDTIKLTFDIISITISL